jgi:hypothetical protein
MDPFVSKSNQNRILLARIVIGVGVVLAAIVVGMVVLNFMAYRNSEGLPPVDQSPAQISIGNPSEGAVLEAGESQMVSAAATGPDAFLSVELWVDGVLAGVQSAPGGLAQPFSTSFYWLPIKVGAHSLIAIAVDTQEQRIISPQVIVIVTEGDVGGVSEASDESALPVVLPEPNGKGYSPPAQPGSGDSVGPADTWNGSPGDWVTNLTTKERPTAPQLVFRSRECGVSLLIRDLSDNEEGFDVFRQTPDSPTWLKIAKLSSQSQMDWLSFDDNGVIGPLTYYVSAFNKRGETASNPVQVDINPADCQSEPDGRTGISLEVTKLMPEVTADMNYCYQSTDGINWTRWPQFGYLAHDEEGYLTGGPVAQLQSNDLSGEPTSPRSSVYMECWGWQNGILVKLGDFFVEDMNPEFFGTQLIAGKGMQAEVAFEPVEIMSEDDFLPGGPEYTGGSDIESVMTQLQLQSWIHPEIPTVTLYQTSDQVICRSHLPSVIQNMEGEARYCFVYPEFDPNQGAISSQPYLAWDVGSTCAAGTNEDCQSYAQLLELAEETEGLVGFDVTSVSNAGTFTWQVTIPNLTMFVVPPLSCTGDMEYNVRMWYKPGHKAIHTYATEGSQPVVGDDPDTGFETAGEQPIAVVEEVYYGMPSNWVTIPCTTPDVITGTVLESYRFLDITFEWIELFDIDDDDVAHGPDVELYGYFRVVAPAMGRLFEEPCFLLSNCDSDDGPVMIDTRRYLLVAEWEWGGESHSNTLPRFFSGHYELSEEGLCKSTSKRSCSYEGESTTYHTNNNTIRVFVKEGDSLTLEVNLVDYDELSDDDIVCLVGEITPSRTLDEWADIQDETYMLQGSMGYSASGWCKVQAVINAVNP